MRRCRLLVCPRSASSRRRVPARLLAVALLHRRQSAAGDGARPSSCSAFASRSSGGSGSRTTRGSSPIRSTGARSGARSTSSSRSSLEADAGRHGHGARPQRALRRPAAHAEPPARSRGPCRASWWGSSGSASSTSSSARSTGCCTSSASSTATIAFFKDGWTALNVLVSVYMWNQAPFATPAVPRRHAVDSRGPLHAPPRWTAPGYWRRLCYVTLPALRPDPVPGAGARDGERLPHAGPDLRAHDGRARARHDDASPGSASRRRSRSSSSGRARRSCTRSPRCASLLTVRLSLADPRAGSSPRRERHGDRGRQHLSAGRYKRRSAGSRLVLYGLVLAVTLWLVGPFVWLFVTSISYQKHLLARPLSFIPPEVDARQLPDDPRADPIPRGGPGGEDPAVDAEQPHRGGRGDGAEPVIGTTAGYAYARFSFPLQDAVAVRAALHAHAADRRARPGVLPHAAGARAVELAHRASCSRTARSRCRSPCGS